MNKLKLIIACAVIVGLSQLKLDGGSPQRKYYTGSKAIKARQEAAAAGQLSEGAEQGGMCAGGICTMRTAGSGSSALHEQMAAAENPTPAKTPEQLATDQAAQETLQAQIAEQQESLRKMQEQLNALKAQANN
jgi:hypothetical protein